MFRLIAGGLVRIAVGEIQCYKGPEGGLSALIGHLLDVFFDCEGHDISVSGVHLNCKGIDLHIFMRLSIVLADEAALHQVYSCKGASGLKPCLLCMNVFTETQKRNVPAHDATGYAVDVSCSSLARLSMQTSATTAAIVRRLAAASGSMTKAAFSEVETTLGWNYEPAGIMFHERWRTLADPTSCVLYDWMHVYL